MPDTQQPQDGAAPPPFERLITLFTTDARLGIGLGAALLLIGLGGLGLLLLSSGGPAADLRHTQQVEAELGAESPRLRVGDGLALSLAEGGQGGRVTVHLTGVEEALTGADDRWLAALGALPAGLVPLDRFYQIEAADPSSLRLTLTPPAGADPALIDIYRWDAPSQAWVFVPSTSTEQASRELTSFAGTFALFHNEPGPLLAGAVLRGDAPPGAAQSAALNMLYVPGLLAAPDGGIDAEAFPELPNTPAGYLVLPILSGAESPDLSDPAARAALIAASLAFVQDNSFDGLLLDFNTLPAEQDEGFSLLVEEAAQAFAPADVLLAVRLPAPEITPEGINPGPYDWVRIGAAADVVAFPLPLSPAEHTDQGQAGALIAWAAASINREKLHPITSGLSIDEWEGQARPIDYAYAAAPLGSLRPAAESAPLLRSPEPGQPLSFELGEAATNLAYDVQVGMHRYDIFVGDGKHRVWLVDEAALRARLEWLAGYHLGGVIVEDALSPDSGAALAALAAFKQGAPGQAAEGLAVHWQVTTPAGDVLQEQTAAFGQAFTWAPPEPGEYLVTADLGGFDAGGLGAQPLIVGGGAVGQVIEEVGVVTGAPDVTVASASPARPGPPSDMPPPVMQPQVFGNFELGGQVNHVITNPDYMKQAGMRWVKFQLAWDNVIDAREAYNFVQQGRQGGFKVLVSITGQQKNPTSIDYEGYLDFVRGVAYYGPDAIEVWNEPNVSFEWPKGEIDGGDYTRYMLAPAYNAIKEVNPNIMVISGAPAPTGAYYAEGGCSAAGYGCDDWLFLEQMAEMGAGSYMDCMGVHFNSGATSPSATTGHPADPGYQHYSWYYGGITQLYYGTFGRPLCFTEYGYLSGEGYGGVPDRFNWAGNTTVQNQAEWLAEAARLSRESGLVRLMIVWNVDFAFWGDDPMAGYAIVRPDGSCPACSLLGQAMGGR